MERRSTFRRGLAKLFSLSTLDVEDEPTPAPRKKSKHETPELEEVIGMLDDIDFGD